MLWCEVSLLCRLVWGQEVHGFLVSSCWWGFSLCDGYTFIPSAWLLFFETMTVVDNLLQGNCSSVYNDHVLISHSDLERSHFMYQV